jgi:UDP-2,3-diacylglucosamine pyrophosphatase LpxH
MDNKQYQLIIVSDLHLSEGWDSVTRRLSRNEDFFFDSNFQRFLQCLTHKAEKNGIYYKLIINGDFVDFLQFTSVPEDTSIHSEPITPRERELGLGTSAVKTLWKLNVLLKGHRVFFNALKKFILSGNEVIIIPGNHDIEWIIPKVQVDFKDKLSENIPDDQKETFKEKIKFVPWFYYDVNFSVFIEHGSQYDDLNSFDYFLYPYTEDGTIYLPAGSFFVRYLFNRVEQYYPFADNMKPTSKFISWFFCRWQKRWSRLTKLKKFYRFFNDTLDKAGPIDKDWEKRLETQQEKKLEEIANETGLRVGQVQDLKKQWAASSIHTTGKWRLFNKFRKNSKLGKKYYMERAALIQKILGTGYIVFGHTHEADMHLLSKAGDGKRIEYVNSGTWTKTFESKPEEALLKSENEFVYVHFKFDSEVNDVRMELLRWNDSIKNGERVRLFSET